MGKPKGAVGVRWGDKTETAAAQIGVACKQSEPSEDYPRFDICSDYAHSVQAFGRKAFIRVLSKDGRLAGLQFIFQNCTTRWDDLRDSVRREFDLSTRSKTDVYQTWSSGEVVHLSRDEQTQVCILTVAGPQFGPEYTRRRLASGLGEFASSLQP